jgi:hypothetical protein
MMGAGAASGREVRMSLREEDDGQTDGEDDDTGPSEIVKRIK